MSKLDLSWLYRPVPKGLFDDAAPKIEMPAIDLSNVPRAEFMGIGKNRWGDDIVRFKCNPQHWWEVLETPQGILRGSGFNYEPDMIDIGVGAGHPPVQTICPDGPQHAGAGWKYIRWPRFSIVGLIAGIDCDPRNACANPKDVRLTHGGSGEIAVGFNDQVNNYGDNTGSYWVWINAVYR